jgi:hypothetical protein
MIRGEAATMSLAAEAGLTVPSTQLVQCAGKSALLVRRVDIIPAGRLRKGSTMNITGYIERDQETGL